MSNVLTGTASSSIDKKMEIDGIKAPRISNFNEKKTELARSTTQMSLEKKQTHTRFCKFCRKSGHTIAYSYVIRDFKEQNRQQPQQSEKFRDNYQSYRVRCLREDSCDRNQRLDKTHKTTDKETVTTT